MTELGKSAKHMGAQHPRVLRHTDPVPERPTPKAKPKHKRQKLFGYAWQWAGPMQRMLGSDAKLRHHWFRTAQQRDQALADAHKKFATREWILIHGPVDRQPQMEDSK